ncbi:MAG: hypothetical protein IJU16_06870, partial [Clostridia bacterium]|nr:hypothetical protein [Clostridia bacterium]
MDKRFTRALAIFSSIALLLALLPASVLSVAAEPDYPTIALNEEKVVMITTAGDMANFLFTPTEDGTYAFYSIADADTYGYLLDKNEEQLTYDDDGGEDSNFFIRWQMTANETYVLRAR